MPPNRSNLLPAPLAEGLEERKAEKVDAPAEEGAAAAPKRERRRVRKADAEEAPVAEAAEAVAATEE